MGAVSSTRIASETGELQSARTNLPSATLNSNRVAALPVTCDKITSFLPHTKSHLDVRKEKESCIVPERELSRQSKKQNSVTTKHTSFLDKTSPTAKKEQYLLHQRQRSGIKCDLSESHGVEGKWSCRNENEKDSNMLMQKPSSDPGFPAEESNQPSVSHDVGDFSKIPKDERANLHLSRSPSLGVKTSSVCDGERTTEKTEMVGGTSLPASQSNKQMPIKISQPGKVLEKLQPRRNPDTGGCGSQPDQGTTKSGRSEKYAVVTKAKARPDNPWPANHAWMSKEAKVTNMKGESILQNSVQASSLSVGVPIPHSAQENYTYSSKSKKVEKLQPRRNPDPVVQESKSDVGSTTSKAPDKGLDDGYNWRKYGQKLVKGNKFVRSYYKCTYPNCQAKKQVERSPDGCKSDINYLGNHHHQKLQHSPPVTSTLQVRTPETPTPSTSKTNAEVILKHASLDQHMPSDESSSQSTVGRSADGLSGAVSCSNNNTRDLVDCPDSKRQKRDTSSVDDVVDRSNSHSRQVVQMLSEVDLVNDGYRWRKYGQKLVKGNLNPRSYYRCSNAGCPVKKHVERASHDPKLVITTYEGQHDHDIPASRTTVSQSTEANMMNRNGESSLKSEDNGPVLLEMAAHANTN